ncbi:YCF48-related protein [Caballeronia sp. SBC2]|uniref:YCF48-related protein n=1 Tax=Caballeronia sp. SBC2 TaxID=2705547 RepID=UPI0013E1D836|nr:YCF48-related protein [Caballeronia sp. SBC2]QIE30210.1 Ycf48-like protein [Caballeronia sp. SBC2]
MYDHPKPMRQTARQILNRVWRCAGTSLFLVFVFGFVVWLDQGAAPARISLVEVFPGGTRNPIFSDLAKEMGGEASALLLKTQGRDVTKKFIGEDEKHAWAFGDGAVYVTADGGQTWEEVKVAPFGTPIRFWNAQFLPDNKRGWAIGANGVVVSTVDGGRHWAAATPPLPEELSGLFFLSGGSTGWIVGLNGAIFRTLDGGRTWQIQASGENDWLTAVQFLDDGKHGWAVGRNGTVVSTDNGGDDWQAQDSKVSKRTLWWIDFLPDGKHGWAGGEGGIVISTRDGGKHWDFRPTPVGVDWEAAYVDAPQKTLWVMGTGAAVTSDDGLHWSVIHNHKGFSGNLPALLFFGIFIAASLWWGTNTNEKADSLVPVNREGRRKYQRERGTKFFRKNNERLCEFVSRGWLVVSGIARLTSQLGVRTWRRSVAWVLLLGDVGFIPLLSCLGAMVLLEDTQQGREILLGASDAAIFSPSHAGLSLVAFLVATICFALSLGYACRVLNGGTADSDTPFLRETMLAAPQVIGTIGSVFLVGSLLSSASIANRTTDSTGLIARYQGFTDSQITQCNILAVCAILIPLVIYCAFQKSAQTRFSKTMLFWICVWFSNSILTSADLTVGSAINRALVQNPAGSLLTKWFAYEHSADANLGFAIVWLISLATLFKKKSAYNVGPPKWSARHDGVLQCLINAIILTTVPPAAIIALLPLLILRLIPMVSASNEKIAIECLRPFFLKPGFPKPIYLRMILLFSVGCAILYGMDIVPISLKQRIGPASLFVVALIGIVWLLTSIVIPVRIIFHRTWVPIFVILIALMLRYYENHESFGDEILTSSNASYSPLRVPAAAATQQDVVVNAHGGGIRAALFTAEYLARLDDRTCGEFGNRIRAISGVSGGSLGIGVYLTLRQALVSQGGWLTYCEPSKQHALFDQGPLENMVKSALLRDHLSAPLVTMLTRDIFPIHAQSLRGQSMLESWQEAVMAAIEEHQKFAGSPKITMPGLEQLLNQLNGGLNKRPLILFNSTDAKTGKRIVFSSAAVDNRKEKGEVVYINGSEADNLNIQVGQAILHSARFPIISPAGKFEKYRLVDGGYIDNSGAETLGQVLPEDVTGLWLDIDGNPTNAYTSPFSPSFFSGIEALLSIHEGSSRRSVRQMCESHRHLKRIPIEFNQNRDFEALLSHAEGSKSETQMVATYFDTHYYYAPPMGWYLSKVAGDTLKWPIIKMVEETIKMLCSPQTGPAVGEPCD